MAQISIEDLNRYRYLASRLQNEVDKLEKEPKEVEQFYQSTDDQKNDCKNKGRENAPTGSKKSLQGASQEMQAELMSHFSKLVCKLQKQRKEAEKSYSYQSNDVLMPEVAHAESEPSEEEVREQTNKILAQEAANVNWDRELKKLNTELSKVESAMVILKATLIARFRKFSRTEISLLSNAINQLSRDNHTKALHIENENSPNFQPSLESESLDFQNDYILWRLHMFVKNSLEVKEGTSVGTHVNNIEYEVKKNNAKKKRVE